MAALCLRQQAEEPCEGTLLHGAVLAGRCSALSQDKPPAQGGSKTPPMASG